MATDKFTAAESIRRLAQLYSAMGEAADALEAMGKLDQAKSEAEKNKKMAEDGRDEAVASLKKAKDDIKAAQEKAAQIVSKANDQALATLGEADQKAQAILDGATAQANGILAAASNRSQELQAGIAGQVANLTSTKVGLESDINSLNQAVSVKQAEVEALESRLSKAQASIAKLLG